MESRNIPKSIGVLVRLAAWQLAHGRKVACDCSAMLSVCRKGAREGKRSERMSAARQTAHGRKVACDFSAMHNAWEEMRKTQRVGGPGSAREGKEGPGKTREGQGGPVRAREGQGGPWVFDLF